MVRIHLLILLIMRIAFKFFNYSSLLQKHELFKHYYYWSTFLNYLKLRFFFSMSLFQSSVKYYLFKLSFLYLLKFLNFFTFSKIFIFFSKYLKFNFLFFYNLDNFNMLTQFLPKRKEHFSILRSSFIYKKSQEQFGKTRFLSFFSFTSYFFF